ncbi:MAG: AAA family ATPase [Bacteroidaceae bacterium]|nr:AAA family ATPase [Bacteroidaceae bacterium]
MLKRKIQNKLESWYESGHYKAPLLYGARQVGKTTAVREFATRHYKYFVEVNFVKRPIAMQAFDGDLTTKNIVTNLSAMGFGPFVEGETLLFLDEIQECPNARTAIKFLVEENVYDYIASGSLLGINYKPVPSYPVGFEEKYDVYPMDFEEFLWAKGITSDVYDIVKRSYRELKPVPDFIHQQLIRYYREYLVVGGMPEVVSKFVEKNDFREVIKAQKSIISTYRADITNYAGKQASLVKRVFDAIPSELGKQDKRFVLANIEKGASLRKYEDPTQWLIDSGVAYYSFNTNSFELPFEATENRRLYKLYMVDTGLLCSQLLRNMQFQVMNGDIAVNEGALTENFVACTLASQDVSLHYYDKKSKLELDFIIADGDGISIIEVKSGEDHKKHASLNNAITNNAMHINRSIVLSKFNVEVDNGIIYLPLYMASMLVGTDY